MEPTASDPSVKMQFGMVAGIPNAGQVNALETLNVRGERSVTCKGKFDAPPGTPLPAGAPPECEKFRQQPDALETAAAYDQKYGSNFDTKTMPLYCTVMSFKGIYDSKDMRTTAGADVNYAMDVPPKDSTLVSRLRAAGAIIYARRTKPNTTQAAAIRAATRKWSTRISARAVRANPGAEPLAIPTTRSG